MTGKEPDGLVEPDEHLKEEIYKLYQAIFHSELHDKKKKLMTYIFAWYPWSWRIVGISKGAFTKISGVEFNSCPKGIVRDHFLQDRNDTYKMMLDCSDPLDLQEWWQLFWQNDQTIMMTKNEHNQGRGSVECLRLNWEDGYFPCASLIGFKYRKTIEGAYLKTLENLTWVPIEEIKSDLLEKR